MARSKKWWWGLPALFLLWVVANWTKTPGVEQDLQTRAASASGDSALTVAGRDVSLYQVNKEIHDGAAQTHGVRLVNDQLLPMAATDGVANSPAAAAVPAIAAVATTSTSANTGTNTGTGVDTSTGATTADANKLATAGITDAQACEQKFATLLSSSKVLFRTSQASLSPTSEATLKELVSIAKTCPKEMISVEGYSDDTGEADLNLSLSERRAASVVAYMKKAGITADHLKAAGFGEAKPIASNDTEEGRAQNRRIELHVADAKQVATTK